MNDIVSTLSSVDLPAWCYSQNIWLSAKLVGILLCLSSLYFLSRLCVGKYKI